MIGAILAQHAPLIRDYPSAPPPPPAPPAPPTPPEPPQAEPITFSAVIRSGLYGEIGTAISSTTLATITCADAAMTIVQSEVVAGLTFSYSAGVLTVAGTPTGSTRVQRVVVSYIASDGSNSVRGSTAHQITLVSVAEVLTIGSIAGITGRVGVPLELTLCTPTANFDADVQCYGATAIRGLTVNWVWDRALRSGTLSVGGTPQQTFGPSGAFSFGFSVAGRSLGSGISSCTIVQAYEPPAPAPAPTPSPPAPSPSPPPAPTPAPAPGLGPDPYQDDLRVLLHFNVASARDSEASTALDLSGENSATGFSGFSAPYCSQADNPGLGLLQRFGYDNGSSAYTLDRGRLSVMSASIAGVGGASDDVSAECLIRPASALWGALFSSGDDARFTPLLTCRRATDGAVIWSLGIGSAVNNLGRYAAVTFVVPVSYQASGSSLGAATAVSSISQPLGYGSAASFAGRLFHAGGSFGSRSGAQVSTGAWADWRAGTFSSRLDVAAMKAANDCIVQIGGDVGVLEYVFWWKRSTTLMPFVGDMDEVRVALNRYAALVGLVTIDDIPANRRTIPFQNPY